MPYGNPRALLLASALALSAAALPARAQAEPCFESDLPPVETRTPVYPRRAATRGIEGFAELEFTVAPDDTPAEPLVAEADPPGIFDRAALAALEGFRFGAQEAPLAGVRLRFWFVLDPASCPVTGAGSPTVPVGAPATIVLGALLLVGGTALLALQRRSRAAAPEC